MRLAATVTVLLAVGASAAQAETRLAPIVRVLGEVTSASRPVENVLVVAFGLSNLEARQAVTSQDGAFRFPPLPSGVYRLIAVKQGFAPAVATIVPGATERLKIKLRPGKGTEEAQSQIWEVRRALPADILRELDLAMMPEPADIATRKFNGEMSSMAGIAGQERSNAFAQTSLALRGTFENWSLDFAGRMQQAQPSENTLDRSVSHSSGVVMALRTSPSQTVRVVSSKNWWLLDAEDLGADQAADIQSHRIEWNRSTSRVELRYMSQENLFRIDDGGSQMIELAGKKRIYANDRGDLGVSVRVWQESTPSAVAMVNYRIADFTTNGRYAAAERVAFTYGVNARVTSTGHAWAPETGMELRVGNQGAIIASGAYKVGTDVETHVGLPNIVTAHGASTTLPKYRYAIGYVNSNDHGGTISAIVSVTEIDRALSIVFDDALMGDDFWEGYVLEAGDLHRDLSINCRRSFGDRVAVDFTTTAAQTMSDETEARAKHYVSSALHSLYRPTGTAIDIAYRLVSQPERDIWLFDSSGERLNVRMAQSLHLPLDLTLLVGVDLARAKAGLTQVIETEEVQRRYVGGLSLAF